ncbi:putative pseudouridylate synthase [Pseudomonas aeruginosa]|nr:putative pseudouridylate synthase [Pseudomonas aeruginosa]
MRLDRFLANLPELSRRDAQMLIAGGRLRVDGQVVRDGTHEVRVFSRVELDERLLQAGKPARYYMLHKPMGCVSATRDPQHPTVLDLFPEDLRDDLHIGGRLDYNTTGLMLLTNDGQWSRRLTLPGSRRDKVYYVETEAPIDQRYVDAFAAGLHFRFEDLVTLPAQLEPIGPRCARPDPARRPLSPGSSACSATSTTRCCACTASAWAIFVSTHSCRRVPGAP